MKNTELSNIRQTARQTRNMQYPIIDHLSPETIQTLMDMSGKRTKAGTKYTVVVSQGVRALRFDQ